MSRTCRRQFLTAAVGLLAAGFARAQPSPKARRIGVLFNRSAQNPPGIGPAERVFLDELARLGFEEGRNLVIERRFAELQTERFPDLARELLRLDVELILALSNSAASAARGATTVIPIVAVMGKPVEYGLIRSYARPGGNITGTDWIPTVAMEQKCYEILKAAVPGATRAARLGYTGAWKPELYGEAFARKIFELTGLALTNVDVGGRPDEIDGALEKIAASRPEVLHVYGHEILFAHHPKIADFAAKRKIVSICELESYLVRGGMLFYGANSLAQMKRLASFVARILRGAKPGDLPVEQPTEFELVFNKKAADAMGVTLPQSFLVRVDRVVE